MDYSNVPALCQQCEHFKYVTGEGASCDIDSDQNEFDAVNKPSHYNQGGVECIDAIESAVTGLAGIEAVCTANAIKYLWRWKYKNGVEDLRKAVWYINRLIGEKND